MNKQEPILKVLNSNLDDRTQGIICNMNNFDKDIDIGLSTSKHHSASANLTDQEGSALAPAADEHHISVKTAQRA